MYAPTGSSLVLFVMDSQGSPGGVPQRVFSVTSTYDIYILFTQRITKVHLYEDGDSSCLPQSPSVSIQMTANVSGTIETCQPVEFEISGGSKPYKITVVQTNSNVINNNTLGSDATNFTFTNNVNANAQIIGM